MSYLPHGFYFVPFVIISSPIEAPAGSIRKAKSVVAFVNFAVRPHCDTDSMTSSSSFNVGANVVPFVSVLIRLIFVHEFSVKLNTHKIIWQILFYLEIELPIFAIKLFVTFEAFNIYFQLIDVFLF